MAARGNREQIVIATKVGMSRHVAASNYSARRLTEALRLGEREGLARYVALQPRLSVASV